MLLSVVVPCYHEQDCLIPLARELTKALKPVPNPYEVILTDDGSTDATWKLIRILNHWDPRFKGLRLAYNAGQTAATAAGIQYAEGKAVITMDADLQNHPEDIPQVLELLNTGCSVVSTWRKDRAKEQFGKRAPSLISNSLARLMTGVDIHDNGSGFKAYHHSRIKTLNLYGSFHRYIAPLCLRPGDKFGEVVIKYRLRVGGKSKYGATRLLKGVRDLIYITCVTRLKNNRLAQIWARFMVWFHYDQGAPIFKVGQTVGFESKQ